MSAADGSRSKLAMWRPGALAQRHPSGRRYIRSREGCLTCKRRKVKCDEQRPRCSHCERLNMECKWRPQSRTGARSMQQVETVGPATGLNTSPAVEGSPSSSVFQPAHVVSEVFDYASFMWDSGDFWQQVTADMGQDVGDGAHTMATHSQSAFSDQRSVYNPNITPSTALGYDSQSEKSALPPGSEGLLEFFANSVNPPILAEVEAQKKWVVMRQAAVEMATVSPMVRGAILAFSNVLLYRRNGTWPSGDQAHYENAVADVVSYDNSFLTEYSPRREHLLTALFFLSYTDILESRLDAAHSNLKRAYGVFQQSNKGSFSSIEKSLLQWIRLLDGRAVSAGGDGLFLSKDDELLLVETSPASCDVDADDVSKQDVQEGDIEDVLFQVLYQPGIVFYQKVQSFMGRISKIDPWHRSRGTVQDETEVMNIGASIATDLRTLYDQRPPLMDYAVAGKLTPPHVSEHLAFVITRAFRTYLSNYYASKVHLHRVAYKTLPLTGEATAALDHIRKLARQIVATLDPEDTLPVNMLWPLLMLGVEERDPSAKAWITAQIIKMEKVAGNARITAQVLEEVQTRQDAKNARIDIREVMHAVFNSCFAIV
ncbi:Sterol uptake control protein 2 [Tolypocladium ophioglossoides CBS 100239]|uniref:Sterol uptake control protein 2 n=1 Tax=Tolypocladium ophioglossoides (strain CBS 100239) TaxID=1163406 RepID=A0A0L0N0U3_TOLOC|nr:Sterol uptake control protein 2 [Tolypocladium ophioglossoides CBS 100239]